MYPSVYALFASTPSSSGLAARGYRFLKCNIMVDIIKILDCITDKAI